MRRARGKLRIHRETLRTLSDARLARVAGGDLVVEPVVRFVVQHEGDLGAPLPRSNGWTTSGSIAVPTC